MTKAGAPTEVLGGLAFAGPTLAARDSSSRQLYVYGALFLIYLILAAVKAARKRAAEYQARFPRADAPVESAPERSTERPHPPRPARPPTGAQVSRDAATARRAKLEKVEKKAYMEQAPEMSTTGAAHAAHHEHLADLAATAIRTEAHIGHLVSEKHPGAHPSSVAARSTRRSGRALLLSKELAASERVRAAFLWNAVLLRRPPLGVPRHAREGGAPSPRS